MVLNSQIILIVQEFRIICKRCQVNIFIFLYNTLLVKIMVIFCDLMSELTWWWNFNRSWPVWVHETETECQIFNFLLWDICIWFIHWNEEMSGCYAALCCLLRNQKEIIAFIWLVVFNKNWVNNCSWLWI